MSTIALTHEAIAQALADNTPLSDDQRAALLSLVAADKRGQALWDAATRWQPIATAPKDGTNVLLVNRKGNIAAGLWMNSLSGTGWWLRGGDRPDTFFNDHHGPTHWMPLPAAPGI